MSLRSPDEELRASLGYAFSDPGLLETALTHASAAFERDGTRGNERLEFLGDAVLGLVVARLLFEAHPDWREGELTRGRAALVNARALARQGRSLGLADYILLGGGNATRVHPLPEGTRRGGNEDAFTGGFRLWEEVVEPHDRRSASAWRVVR